MATSRQFRFGVQLATADSGQEWTALAAEAEQLGYSTLLIPDHFGKQLAPTPALAAAAAATTHLRVGSLVLDNDFRHPVVTAKEAATLDVLSGGRLELGIGAGWLASDYERSGIPMDPATARVDRLAEALTVLKGLFADGRFSFKGDHYQITDYEARPKPTQKPHPPLLVGGGGSKVLSLAAREVDIVGVNPKITSGRVDRDSSRDTRAEATDRKLEQVRKAAGERYADIEINFLIFACTITEDRKGTLDALADSFGMTPEELSEAPHAWIGNVDEICEQLIAGRERWDASYLIVQGVDAMRAAAPVVARLSGT